MIGQRVRAIPDLRGRPRRHNDWSTMTNGWPSSNISRSWRRRRASTINRMLTLRASTASRPRAAAELPRFNYMILQAYDFLECRARRLAAADGRLRPMGEYRQRHRSHPPPRRHPALRRHDAFDHHRRRRQVGKTAKGAVWLNAVSPAPTISAVLAEHQDGDVGKFLRLFTDLPLDEIAAGALGGAERTTPRRSSATPPPQ